MGRAGLWLPFRVAPVSQAAKLAAEYGQGGHIVIDTGQWPAGADLKEAVDGSDLLIIPATPSPLDTDGLVQTIGALQRIGVGNRFRVLLTKVAPPPERDGAVLRELLVGQGVAIFKAEIPLLKAFAKAAGAGEIVGQTKGKNATRAWELYIATGKELL